MEPTMSFAAPISTPADVTATAVSPEVPSTEFAPEVPVTAPQQVSSFENISIYAESISQSSSNDPSQAVFDIVLTVGWSCPTTGEYKNAKILKTISFNKQNLADQTNVQQVTFVESKQPEKKTNSKLLKNMRELAGVQGKGTFV